MLASMAAHVGPLSPTGTRNDVRKVFLALRPGIDVFLDLVDGPFPKALRLVAEAGVPTWSQPEIAAGALSLVQSEEWLNCSPALLRRLLAALRIQSKVRVAELCLAAQRTKRCCTMPEECRRSAIDTLAGLCARHAPQLDRWKAMVASSLSRRLCPDVVGPIVELATTVDIGAIVDVQARHMERLVDLEVRRAEREFIRHGTFSLPAYLEWTNRHAFCRHLGDVIRACRWKFDVFLVEGNVTPSDVTPADNRAITVYEVEMYGRPWAYAHSPRGYANTEAAAVVGIRESIAFIREHRTKTPSAYAAAVVDAASVAAALNVARLS